MRLLILTFYYEPDLCAGSFRATALVNKLKEKISDSDTVDIITTMPNRYKSFNSSETHSSGDKRIKIDRINTGTHKGGFADQSLLFYRYAKKTLRIIKKREKYDIVFATSSRLMTAFLGTIVSKQQKAKLYLDLRDIFTDTLESIFAGNWKRALIPVFRKIEKFTVRSADHINLVSDGFRPYFSKLYQDCEYSFFTNGIDDEFLNTSFAHDRTDGKKIITYAGNIGSGQGLEHIIPEIASGLSKDYIINIVGDGGTKDKLLESVKGLDNVTFLPPVNRQQLLEIYKNSDYLFLHLNKLDAFKKVLPSKIFEYAATGKFIIAGVEGYAESFINDNIDGAIVFEPSNADDFFAKFGVEADKCASFDRHKFIEKYTRMTIMDKMADSVIRL